MQGAYEPPQRDLVIQSLQAIPGFSGRRHVNQRQHDAGNDLQQEDNERGAAENIKPASRFARHRMFGRLLYHRADLQTRVQPIADGFNQTHGRISRTRFEAWPGVGISPVLIRSFPPSIL